MYPNVREKNLHQMRYKLTAVAARHLINRIALFVDRHCCAIGCNLMDTEKEIEINFA